MNHHYNKNLKEFAHELRNETVSKAEKFIWKALLSKSQTGYKFKRQRPIDRFIVDFFCAKLNLIIEIDGNSHLNKGEYDYYRENRLKSLGFHIVRFKEGDVLQNFNQVHSEVMRAVEVLDIHTGNM
jgi:very-short-patch-repair endonuclease